MNREIDTDIDLVKVGDIVTIEQGDEGEPGYVRRTITVQDDEEMRSGLKIGIRHLRGLIAGGTTRLVGVTQVVDPNSPWEARMGDVFLTPRGVAFNDGAPNLPWVVGDWDAEQGTWYGTQRLMDLCSPVRKGVVVPEDSLNELFSAARIVAHAEMTQSTTLNVKKFALADAADTFCMETAQALKAAGILVEGVKSHER